MNHKFQERISYSGDINILLKEICSDYDLGEFESKKIIDTGYEDFNLVLTTTKKSYFVKFFGKFRNLENCKRYIEIITKVVASNIHTPQMLLCNEKYLYELKIENVDVRLCVMDYIEGKDLYQYQRRLASDQIRFIAEEAALINSLDLRPAPIYDSWAVVNFSREFTLKSRYLSPSDLALITPVLNEFNKIKLETLPHCFVHGDIINTNVLINNDSELFIIDFSVSNFYPRVVELAVLCCNLFFDKRDIPIALDAYTSVLSLSDQELDILPIFVRAAHAMHLLCANYEKCIEKNDSDENEYWLNLGRKGLLVK